MDAGGTSVLEDSLVGLVHMLGHLWCSALQGQLQEKEGRERTYPWGSSVKGWERELAPDGKVSLYMCVHAWQGGSTERDRCELKQRGWP